MKNENISKYKDEFIAVGLKIGYLRRQKAMTQDQLAEKAGISVGFLRISFSDRGSQHGCWD